MGEMWGGVLSAKSAIRGGGGQKNGQRGKTHTCKGGKIWGEVVNLIHTCMQKKTLRERYKTSLPIHHIWARKTQH